MNSALITKSMHKRGLLATAILIAVASALITLFLTEGPVNIETEGFVSAFSGEWHITPEIGIAAESVITAAILLMMMQITKVYNLLRTMSMLHGSLFLIMQASTPSVYLELSPGNVLCLVVLFCVSLIYFTYMRGIPVDTRKIFLVFAILSGCSSFDSTFVIYVGVFMLCCLQLRLFSLRTFSSMILGIITPWIIMLGLGIVEIDQLQWPAFDFKLPEMDTARTTLLITTVGITVAVGMCALLQNLIKIISYNTQSRAMLSVVTTLTVVTMAAIIIDFSNVFSYLTLLNCCVAFQLAHIFIAIHNYPKSYIGILSVIVIYICLFVWRCTVY